MEEFAIDTRSTPLAEIVRIKGDADVFVAPQLREELEALVDGAPPAVVVDMGELTFLDSSTLSLLLTFRRRLADADAPLLLVCDNRALLRTFEVTALDREFEIVPTLTDALRAAGPRAAAAA